MNLRLISRAPRNPLDGVPDAEVLQIAAREGRILVSHDENSMPGHFYEFLANNSHSPGLLMVPQDAPIGAVVESIVLIWLASEADEWLGKITWLPL